MTPPTQNLQLLEQAPASAQMQAVQPAPTPTRAPRPVVSPLTTEVVVITDNSHADLVRSLPAIQEAVEAAGAQLLFVDLGSVDDTRAYVAKHSPGARGVWLEPGDSLADVVNVAAAASEAEVLVLFPAEHIPASPDAFARLVKHLAAHPYAAIAAPALMTHSGDTLPTARPDGVKERFSAVEALFSQAMAVRRSDLQDVTNCCTGRAHGFEQLHLCMQLRRHGREIHYVRSVEYLDAGGRAAAGLPRDTRFLAVRAWRLLMRHPGYALRLFGRFGKARLASDLLRHVVDIALSSVLLAILAPVLLAIAVAVKLDSPGPVIFRQRRLGHGGKQFTMYKFRTMRQDCDAALHQEFVRDMIVNHLQAGEDSPVQVFKLNPDPRVTRLGRILRRSSLDELLQLFNVLRGDMTLIGFRPPIPYEVSEYPDWYFRRFDGKPGITGLWQVSGRNERSYEEMVSLDIEYLNRRSVLFDVQLLLRTISVVVTGRGAY